MVNLWLFNILDFLLTQNQRRYCEIPGNRYINKNLPGSEIESIGVFQDYSPGIIDRKIGQFMVNICVPVFIEYQIQIISLPRIIS